MSHSNTNIFRPITMPDDMSAVLSITGTDLEQNCKTSQINKWAMYKPERYAEGDTLSIAQRKANYFSLTPETNDKAKQTLFGYGGTDAHNVGDSGYTIADIMAANEEWPYRKPTGGTTSPYRLSDFDGYNAAARSPIYGWTDWTLYENDLDAALNQAINNSGEATAWKLTGNNIVWSPYQVSCRIAEGSGSYINGGGGDMIPLSWLLGGIETEYWRIAIAVDIGDQKLFLFTSPWPLKDCVNAGTSMDAIKALPNIASNQYLCARIKAILGSSAQVQFNAFPIMVKNTLLTRGSYNGSNQTLVTAGSSAVVYSVPSSAMTFNIIVKGAQKPTCGDVYVLDEKWTTDKVFVFGYYYTGQTTGSGTHETPLYGIGIFLADGKSFSGTKTLSYNFTYSYGVNGYDRITQTLSGTISITNSDIVSVSGINKVGKLIVASQPAVGISSSDRIAYV